MEKRDKKKITGLIVFVIVLGIMAMSYVPLVVAEATVVFIPDVPSAESGFTYTVPINITDVTNLCGADIWLNYDKDIVIAESVSDGNLGEITHTINNTIGATRMNWDSTKGKTGSFVFAHITLKAVGVSGDKSLLDVDVKELYDCELVDISHIVNDAIFKINADLIPIFDTGKTTKPYPSIFGTHNGTLTPNQTITVYKLYTYPCFGTGGHLEYVKIWNETWDGLEAYWNSYKGDWRNITFDPPFTLDAATPYNYTMVTGSYPQIIHESSKEVTGGIINCTEFIDANGGSYNNNWIPAIRLEGKLGYI